MRIVIEIQFNDLTVWNAIFFTTQCVLTLTAKMHTPDAVHNYRNSNLQKPETIQKWESLLFNNSTP